MPRVELHFGGEARGAVNAARETRAEIDKIERSARHTAGAVEKDMNRMGRGVLAGSGAFRSLGRSLAYASTAYLGGAGLAFVLRDSISKASDLHEQMNKVDVVFGRSARSVKEWSKTSATSMGEARSEALAFAGTFGNLLRPMGVAPALAATMSKSLVQLSSDMASFNNASPEDTLRALESGLTGQVRPLRQFGVFLDQARIKAVAASTGIVKASVDVQKVGDAEQKVAIAQAKLTKAQKDYGPGTTQVAAATNALHAAQRALNKEIEGGVPPLTAQQKALATYKIVVQDTKLAQGDFQRTSGGLANQQRILRAELAGVEETIGTALMPTVTRLLRHITEWLDKSEKTGSLQRQINAAVKTGSQVIADIARGMKTAFDDANRLAQAFGGWKKSLELVAAGWFTYKAAMFGAMAATRVQAILTAGTIDAALISTGIGALIVAAGVAATLIIQHWSKVRRWLGEFGQWMKKWGPLVVLGVTGPFGAAAVYIVTRWGKVKGWFTGFFEWIQTRFANMIRKIGEGLARIPGWLPGVGRFHRWGVQMEQWADGAGSSVGKKFADAFSATVTAALNAVYTAAYAPQAGQGTAEARGRGAAGAAVPGSAARFGFGSPVTAGVRQGRTDMGVDYSGVGYILAIDDGVVTYLGTETGSGHGGNGPFMIYKIAAGYVYVAEQWTPLVKVGDQVKKGQPIGRLTGHIEIGWAAGPTGNWNTAAAGHYKEGQVTAEGQSFAAAVSGAKPPSSSAGTTTTTTADTTTTTTDTTPTAGTLTVGTTPHKPKRTVPPLVPQALLNRISSLASQSSAQGDVGRKAERLLQEEEVALEQEAKILRGKLAHAKGKVRDQISKALTKVENEIRVVHQKVLDAVIVSGDALLPANLRAKLTQLQSQFKAEAAMASVMTGKAAADYSAKMLTNIRQQSGTYAAEVVALNRKLRHATGRQKAAIREELAKVQQALASVNEQILSALEASVQADQANVSGIFATIKAKLDAQFEKQTQKMLDALGAQFFQGGALTPAEQALKAFQDAQQQKSLQDALAAATTPEERAAAEEAIALDRMQAAATAERVAADKAYAAAAAKLEEERAAKEQAMNDALDAMLESVLNGTGSFDDLKKVAAEYGVTITDAAIPEMKALTDATSELARAFRELARWIAKLTGTAPGAETGGVGNPTGPNGDSVWTDPGWWRPGLARGGKLPGRYLGRADTMMYRGTPGETVIDRGLTAALEQMVSTGGLGGGDTHFHITSYAATPEAIRRELERMVYASNVPRIQIERRN